VEDEPLPVTEPAVSCSLRWLAVLFNEPPEADPRRLLDALVVQTAAKLGLPRETETGNAVSFATEGNTPT